ncbi:glycosyltransferase [Sphingobacterium anhuiense]|uniref:glycosyltransferase n=1 Tax=Sphingobacterium anhuiense TaxID=493780 RepID=UPI003C305801
MTISAFLPVFNEEARISHAMQSLQWCDEIILVDKNSTDRTKEIALTFGDKVKVITMQNSDSYDASEWQIFLDNCSSEWVILFTASDLIHPKLAIKIRSLISERDFPYDVLDIPFRRYVLGLDSNRSPWNARVSTKVMRKSSIFLDQGDVHNVAQFLGRRFTIQEQDNGLMYHLTHVNVDKMMSNHIRYWRAEGQSEKFTLKSSAKNVFKEIFRVTILKRTFLLGYDGLMLTFAYLSYFMMSYVYKWEAKRGDGQACYSKIRSRISGEWENYN